MPNFIDLSGARFSRLVVVSRAEKVDRRTLWNCKCDCGNNAVVDAGKLRSGHTRSCGCLQVERASAANLKHGQSSYPNAGRSTKEYNTWALMIRRCHSAESQDFGLYGARGIYVCDRWRNNFADFYADMGPAPSQSHSIERLDNNGPYAPHNCKWATPKEQRSNQRRKVLIQFSGKSMTPMEWAEATGIPNKRIYARLKRGWSVERALTTPV